MKHMKQFEDIYNDIRFDDEMDDVPMDTEVKDEFAEQAYDLFADIKRKLGVDRAMEIIDEIKYSLKGK